MIEMKKALWFLIMFLVMPASYAAMQYVPVPTANRANAYDPRDIHSRGPLHVVGAAPSAVTTNAVQSATSPSYIIQLMRWGAPPNPYRVPMVNANGSYNAYYRDAFTGADFFALAFANNDQWVMRAISPTTDGGSTTTSLDSNPLIFYSSVSGVPNCFYSPGWLYYVCGSTGIDVQYDDLTQCDPAGNWTFQLLYNSAVVDQQSFTMNLRVPALDLPPALDQNPTKFGYVDGPYDDICKDTATGDTVSCDPNNIPANEPWQPYKLSDKACAMTTTAMAADFHGGQIFEGDLDNMNSYLSTHGGYNPHGDVDWPNVVPYGSLMGAQWSFTAILPANDQGMRNDICHYGPQIMGVNRESSTATSPRHFVLAYGKTQNTMASSWRILDPNGGVKTTSANYFDHNLGERLYKGAADYYPFPIYGFKIPVYSPVELVVTAPDGREKTGFDPVSGKTYNSIPNAMYSAEGLDDDVTGEPDPHPVKFFYITGPAVGKYTIQVIGTGSGTYSMQVVTLDTNANEAASTELVDVPTSPGEVQQYTLNYGGSATAPLTFQAGYAGGGQSKQVNAFLQYSSPAAARIKVSANVTSYRIAIQYGSTILPATFSATLNGNDVSTLFTPVAGTSESVSVPLKPGSNKLLFKVQGVETNGHTATDRDSFTLIVG